MKIYLKCCCGAEIELVSDWESDARKYADDWQERHKDCKPPIRYIPYAPQPAPIWRYPYTTTCEGTARGEW